jgi:ABC-type transporter Mla subunit MlaD
MGTTGPMPSSKVVPALIASIAILAFASGLDLVVQTHRMAGFLEQVGNRLDALQGMNRNLAAMKGQLDVTNAQLSRANDRLNLTNARLDRTNAGLQNMKGSLQTTVRDLGTMNGQLAGMRSDLSTMAKKITHAKLLF